MVERNYDVPGTLKINQKKPSLDKHKKPRNKLRVKTYTFLDINANVALNQ